MKQIHIAIGLTDDLGITSVTFLHNDTHLPSDSKLIGLIGMALLKSIHLNKEDCELQDMLGELGIVKEK